MGLSNNRTMQEGNQTRRAITLSAAIFLQRFSVIVLFSPPFILSMPSEVIIEFVFLGINMSVWAVLRAHFNPGLGAQPKINMSRAQKRIYTQELSCFIAV